VDGKFLLLRPGTNAATAFANDKEAAIRVTRWVCETVAQYVAKLSFCKNYYITGTVEKVA
jgi:hypothetical protein